MKLSGIIEGPHINKLHSYMLHVGANQIPPLEIPRSNRGHAPPKQRSVCLVCHKRLANKIM